MVTTDLNAQKLAEIAEARVWRVILDADEQVSGLSPSNVRDQARRRVEFLEARLCPLSVSEADYALDSELTTEQRDRAFHEAALSMRATLQMIAASAGQS